MQVLASARDWFDWSGWSFTVGGTLLSLLGLCLTFREARAAKLRAREARTAAQLAHAAAVDAVRAVSARVTAGDLLTIRRDLEAVLAALEGRDAAAALPRIRTTRAALSRMRERITSAANRREVGRVLEDVAELQETLELAVHENGRPPRFIDVSARLSKHMDTLSRWSEQMHFRMIEAL